MHDPWPQTTIWRFAWEGRVAADRGGEREKKWEQL